MKRTCKSCLILLLVVLSSCAQPASPVFVLDRNKAIQYSYNWLVENHREEAGFEYDGADYAQVEFPNKDKGAVVVIGASRGPLRGYTFLYRVKGDQVELVESKTDAWDWGVRDIQSGEKAPLEVLKLYKDAKGDTISVLKITGAGHHGSGLWSIGHFQIVEITEGGLHVVFADSEAELSYNPHGQQWQYTYKYDGVNDDGNKEIIKQGQECDFLSDDMRTWTLTNCKNVNEVYRYDGTEYKLVQ